MNEKKRCEPASAGQVIYVSREDLPVSCPMPNMTLWNSHPRVYLPLEAAGQAQCPYCSAVFVLRDSAEANAGHRGQVANDSHRRPF